MDIEGLGERTVMQLSDAGLATDPGDVLLADRRPTSHSRRLCRVSAEKLLESIEGSKTRPLPRILTALGIKHLGPSAAEALAARSERWTPSCRWPTTRWPRSTVSGT